MAKRFYKNVAVVSQGRHHVVTLDNRVLKTPGKQDLAIDSQARAKLVAAEWQAQKEDIQPETMPCTRLMNVACELTPSRRPELVSEFRSYCETDLLCFRASEPHDLAERQAQIWQPVLDWAAREHGIALLVISGVTALPQPGISLSAATSYAQNLNHTDLTLLLHLTASFGSGILALAVMEKYLDMKTAYTTSRLDEIFQNERWGEDEEAVARNANILDELLKLAKLIEE